MKNFTLLFFTLFVSSCAMNQDTEYLNSDEKVYLKVATNTTEEELVNIAAELLAERNITIDFQGSEFDNNGKLVNLDLKVDFNDGNTGSTQAEKIALMVNKFGFIRDYSGDSKKPMQIGTVNCYFRIVFEKA